MLEALLLAAKTAAAALAYFTGLTHTLQTEKREPTTEELAGVKAHQKAIEDAWAALAPK